MSYTPSTDFSFEDSSYTPSANFNFDDSLAAEISDPVGAGVIDTMAWTVIVTMTLADPAASGLAEAIASQLHIADLYAREVAITQQIFERYAASATIEQQITATTYSLSAAIEQTVFETGSQTTTIRQLIYGASALAAPYWRLQAWLGAADISSRLTGQITVDAEESAARIAELTIVPTAGAFQPQAYVNQPLRIEYIALSAAGVEQARYPVFQGRVDTPEFDAVEKTIRLQCTDNLQRIFDGRSRAEIAAIVDGEWASWVFNADAQPWNYAQDRLSTQAAAFDLDINLQPTKTAWAAKEIPDFTFDESAPPYDGSLSIRLSSGKSLTNSINARIQYRYERLLERRATYSWGMSISQIMDGLAPPTPQIIAQAIQGTGWSIHTLHLKGLPNPGYYANSDGASIGYLADCPRYTYAAEAAIVLTKRWIQTYTEDWALTITAPASIATMGPLRSEYQHSASNEIDRNDPTRNWTALQDYLQIAKLYDAGPFSPNCDRVILEHHLELQKYTEPSGTLSRFAATGDLYRDLDGSGPIPRSAFQDGYKAVVAKARADILASHRDTTLTAAVPIAPRIDRQHTVRLDAGAVSGKGKVRQVSHLFDLDTGEATTTLSLAISKPFGASAVSETPITTPAKPAASQAAETVTKNTTLPTWDTAQPLGTAGWDPKNGRFTIPTYGVQDTNVQAGTKNQSAGYTVVIPDDELTLET